MTKHKKLTWNDVTVLGDDLEWTNDMIELEDELTRANKRADKWMKATHFYIKHMNINCDMYEKQFELTNKAELKQKKAWIAFYIATVIYIVGIIISANIILTR